MKMREKLYFTILSSDISEGGMARNNAFFNFVKFENFKLVNVFSKSYLLRLFNLLKFVWSSLFLKNKIIFVHLGVLSYLFPPRIVLKYFRSIFKLIIKRLDKNNFLIIEINDLPYEQSIDLELDVFFENKIFQQDVFNLRFAKFIFASNFMKDYAIAEYFSYDNKCYVVRNGAPELKNEGDNETFDFLEQIDGIKAVYAGTLHKGRQINELIKLFEGLKINLILLGSGGEWINEFASNNNIFYLGNFQEDLAHQIVSKCDLSLLPYDSDRFYYNLCYPTKVPFYFTALTPILSTPLYEVQKFCCNGILYSDFNGWSQILKTLELKDLHKLKEDIEFRRYTWSEIFSNFLNEKPW